MRAFVVRAHGGLEALRLEDVREPSPGPGEVLVEVRACGLNHLDVWMRRGVPGHTFPLPLVPGSDVAGVVRAVGAGVGGVALGDEVIVHPATSCGACLPCLSGRDYQCRSYAILGEHRDGGYAELVTVPLANVIPKPPALSFPEAAAIGIAFLTAWHMLVARAELRPGETVLVQAAASGVGSAAVQIAKLWGATVIATASSHDKLERVAALGADHLIDYSREDVAKGVRAITGGKGVEVVVEHVGPATFEGSMRSLAWHGRLVTCGSTTGSEVQLPLRALFFKAQSVLGSTMGSKGELREVVEHVLRGALRPVVDRVLPLAEAAEGHRLLEARQVAGKIVLAV